MRPIISYYGGKQRMASKIIRYLPKHTVYVEPFCGGAAVFFRKPWPKVTNADHYREVLNDLDGQLINFYRVLQDKDTSEELIRRLQFTAYSRSEYKLAVDICNGRIPATNIAKAWAYFVNINMSFGNKINGGFGTSTYRSNHGKTWVNRVERLEAIIERLAGVYIENDNAINVIKRWDRPQTLFYCDPPYINAIQGYTHNYTIEQYKELIATLNDIKGSFVLSGYNNEYVNPQWDKVVFKAVMSASRSKPNINKNREECIWMVDKSHTVRPEIKTLFDSGKFDCFPHISPEEIK